jgi:hypothetical protein
MQRANGGKAKQNHPLDINLNAILIDSEASLGRRIA